MVNPAKRGGGGGRNKKYVVGDKNEEINSTENISSIFPPPLLGEKTRGGKKVKYNIF